MEADFDLEIAAKNKSSKQLGQIINSINNIYNIHRKQQELRGKRQDKQTVPITEDSKDIVKKLNAKLHLCHQTIDELHKVHSQFGQGYNMDIGYAEEIEAENNKLNAEREERQRVKDSRSNEGYGSTNNPSKRQGAA